jgi:hypothetical protein
MDSIIYARALTGTVGAQEDRAAALFREGRELAKNGNYAAACPKFLDSYGQDPKTGTALNIGDCQEHLGRLALALQTYEQTLKQLKPGDDRIAFVKERIATLGKRVARLTIVADAGATVRRDDEDVPASSIGQALTVDPGGHVVVVSTPGKPARKIELVVKEGEEREVDVRAEPSPRAAPASSPPRRATEKPTGAPTSTAAGGSNTLAWVSIGVGAAGLVASGVGAAVVLSKKSTMSSHCDASAACDQEGLDAASSGKTFSTIGTVGFVVGVVGLGVGGYLLFSSPDEKTAVGVGPGTVRLSRSF